MVLNVSSGESIQVSTMVTLIQERCEKILGYKPELSFNLEDTACYGQELKIVPSEIVQNIGKPNDKISEIDELLSFCNKNFSECN